MPRFWLALAVLVLAAAAAVPGWTQPVPAVPAIYELDPRRIPSAALPPPLTPPLVPDADAWRARAVAADPRDDEARCPGNR